MNRDEGTSIAESHTPEGPTMTNRTIRTSLLPLLAGLAVGGPLARTVLAQTKAMAPAGTAQAVATRVDTSRAMAVAPPKIVVPLPLNLSKCGVEQDPTGMWKASVTLKNVGTK